MGVLGIILGILGLIIGLVGTLLGGWTGGAVAILLAAVAIILGFVVRKKKGKGMGAIIIGILAVVLSVAMIVSTSSMMETLKANLLKELNQDGSNYATVSKYAEKADTNTGFLGFIASMAGNVSEEDKTAFEEEIKNLTTLITESSDTGSAPAAVPAEDAAEEPAG